MLGTPGNEHPDAFCKADPAEAAGRLVKIIRELKPRVMVTEPVGGGYEHPDHVNCHTGERGRLPRRRRPGRLSRGRPGLADRQALRPGPDRRRALGGVDPRIQGPRPRRLLAERRAERAERHPGPETATVALDVRPYTEVQRRALLSHRTQINPEGFWAKLSEDLRRRAFSTAYFVRLHPAAEPGEREHDLLEGLGLTVEDA